MAGLDHPAVGSLSPRYHEAPPARTTIDDLPYELLLVVLGCALNAPPQHNASPAGTTSAAKHAADMSCAQCDQPSRLVHAQLRSVCKAWRAGTDEQVHSLCIRSWPSPFSIPQRFPHVQHVHLQQLTLVPQLSPTSNLSSARRHTRSQGPPPVLPASSPSPAVAAAASLNHTLAQLPSLRSLLVEQAWQGPVRGRTAQTLVAAVVAHLTQLTSLRSITLTGDGITHLPAGAAGAAAAVFNTSTLPPTGGIAEGSSAAGPAAPPLLPHLTRLVVDCKRLHSCPVPVEAAPGLQVLHLPALPGLALPGSTLQRLHQLRSLDLQHCQLAELPSPLCGLTQLTHLDVSNNMLSALPVGLGSLTNLHLLDCSENRLASLPNLSTLSELRALNVSSNWQLGGAMLDAALPAALPQLEVLDLSGTGSAALLARPSMPRLHTLLLSCNELSEVPGMVESCKALRNLALDHNELSTLPAWLCHLPQLVMIDVASNQLSNLPADIGRLAPSLTTLHAPGNALTSLPPSFAHLSRLADLDLQENKLGPELPAVVWSCTALESLCIAGNGLVRLPASLANLQRLSEMDISFNRLASLPWPVASQPPFSLQPPTGADAAVPPPPALPAGACAPHIGQPGGSGAQAGPSAPAAALAHPMDIDTAAASSVNDSGSSSRYSGSSTGNSRGGCMWYLPQLEVLKLRGNCLQGSGRWWARASRATAPRLLVCDLEDELLGMGEGEEDQLWLHWPLPPLMQATPAAAAPPMLPGAGAGSGGGAKAGLPAGGSM